MSADDESECIAVIAKGEARQVRVRLRARERYRFLDMRVFTESFRPGGGWLPSKEGFTLPLSSIPDLLDAVMRVAAKTAGHTKPKGG